MTLLILRYWQRNFTNRERRISKVLTLSIKKMIRREKREVNVMSKFLTNKERFEGKEVDIYAPFGGRLLDKLLLKEVIEDNCIYGESLISGIETAYYLSDGIRVSMKA